MNTDIEHRRCAIVIGRSKDYHTAMGELLVRANELRKRHPLGRRECKEIHEEINAIDKLLHDFRSKKITKQ